LCSIDALIVQVENHEALAASALRELERGVVRSRLHLTRVKKDGKNLAQALADEREAVIRWRDRARREEDESRALECLRRYKRSEARVTELEDRLTEHVRVEQQLGRDVQALERRLTELREQRNTMQTRQARAEAFDVVQGLGDPEKGEIGHIFERWDTRVTETEIASGCMVAAVDDFDESFVDAEETASLKLELRALKEEA